MSERVESPLEALASARAELFAALEGATQDDLRRTVVTTGGAESTVLELLWLAGALDDWTRLAIDQGLGGRPVVPRAPRARPAYLETPDLLRAWLEQTRSALLARARWLDEDTLDAGITLPDAQRVSVRELLEHAAAADRLCTEQVRPALKALQ